MVFTMHPVNPANITQGWGQLKTGGVIPDPNGTPIQQLVFKYGNYQPHGHDGWDYGVPIGTPVVAPGELIIEWSGWGTDMPAHLAAKYGFVHGPGGWPSGIIICFSMVQNPLIGGYVAHLSRSDWDTRLGSRLKAGTLMGLSGNTGRSGGPHVHFSAIRFPVNYSDPLYSRVNPGLYFKAAPSITLNSSTIDKGELTVAEADRVIKEVNKYTAALLVNQWRDNKGVIHPGGLLVVEENQRRITANQAILKNLTAALAKVAGGETFDEAKLLAGIAATAEQSAFEGMKRAIESISAETTVTVDVNPAGV